MDSKAMIKRTLDYQKAAFDAGFNTMVILQGQAEKMTTDMWEKSSIPQDTIKALETTLNEYKKTRDDLKKMLDDGFSKLEAMLNA
jgi:hypothetical protein